MSLVLCCPAPAAAQSSQLAGFIRDSTGALITGADVALENEKTGVRRETRSNTSGLYSFPLLSSGTYRLTIEAPSFRRLTKPGITLTVGESARLDVTLDVAGVETAVSVEASSGRAHSTGDGAVSTVIDRRFIENMPLSGRTLHTLLEQTPGVVAAPGGGFSSNGQRTDMNQFKVDGVSGNVSGSYALDLDGTASGQAPATTVTGGTNGLIAIDALEEFRIETSSFAPEHGRTPGAQISLVSRSGANRLTGSAFEQFRHEQLAANNWFTNSRSLAKPKLRQNAFGGVLGGPVVTDRLFYFASYEGLRLRQPRVSISDVPTSGLRQAAPARLQPLFNALPLPTGSDVGVGFSEYAASVSDPVSSDSTSVRVDAALAAGGRLFARYVQTPSTREQQYPAYRSPTDLRLRTFTVGFTQSMRSSMTFDVRGNYSDNKAKATAQPGQDGLLSGDFFPSFVDFDRDLVGYTVGGTAVVRGLSVNNRQEQAYVAGTWSWVTGRHLIKTGAEYRRLSPRAQPRNYNQVATLGTPAAVLAGTATSGVVERYFPVETVYPSGSVYGQDTWTVSDRIALTYGVRWDPTDAPAFAPGEGPRRINAIEPIADMDYVDWGPLWRAQRNHFAPRFGGSWALDADSKTVLTGGIGLFYDYGTQGSSRLFSSNVNSRSIAGATLPLSAADTTIPDTPRTSPPYPGFVTVIDPNLDTSHTTHWNVQLDRTVGRTRSVNVAFLGAEGRDLVKGMVFRNGSVRFPGTVTALSSNGRSRYRALQTQYRQRGAAGVQLLASYTLSDSKDDGSSMYVSQPPGSRAGVTNEWGPSAFDVRHNATVTLSWDVPYGATGRSHPFLNGWGLDIIARARSATPINVTLGRDTLGIGTSSVERPDLVAGQPLYLDDPLVPGGRRINRDAFVAPAAGVQGSLGRYALRGLAASQVDLAVRRTFDIVHATRLQLRVDFFNLFNQANFANPSGSLTSSSFGIPTQTLNTSLAGTQEIGGLSTLYQWGGPRTIEVGLKVLF